MKNSMILVVGGAGYIGSHVVLALQEAGYPVLVLDNLVYGHRDLVEEVLRAKLVIGDIGDRSLLRDVFATYPIGAVLHFAAYAYVGESAIDPGKYYRNNVANTVTLLEAMREAGVDRLVFSSTCATYGIPDLVPIPENHPQQPINPYGASKWMVERILADYHAAYRLNYVCFRYFNAAGADPEGRLGEDHDPETHLIPLVLQTALGQRDAARVFGTDYPTPDGTCIRDFIHVRDLADAHVAGLEYLLRGGESTVFNLGNGNGFSVRQVIDTARRVTGKSIPVVESPRRPGDPPILVGEADKARLVLGWTPHYSDLESIVTHAWRWHCQRHG
ncbi:UDP-glucose 4-epimerase GalE [Pannus brasiliensis CCIBt3594]|uniref:UDP-glucose 4-epimerase n=1 Tax=Pannus brasiliensis CCIBt3594 TaxID=1427578 RepID=A0AAW9QQQ3_9CHRO